LKFLSHVWSIARGSVGGITYTANQWAALIARVRVSPVNPSTPYQSVIRSSLAASSANWKVVSEAIREGWNDYALTCEYTGPLGTYFITGRLMFAACLSFVNYIDARGLYDFTILPTAPTIPGFYSPGPIVQQDPTTVGTGIGLSISNVTGIDGVAFIERSHAFNPTRERFKGPFLASTAQAVAIPTGTSTLIEFMGLQEDYAYFTKVRLVTDEAPFRISTDYIFRHIAVLVSV
jgi:hypothetical protein